jgi:hypothetical protein
MRTFAIILTLLLGGLVLSSAAPETACAQLGCGIKPIKPITPIGCTDLCPVCECDERGRNCKWKWVCC